MSEPSDVVRRAFEYPYSTAQQPFVLFGDRVLDPDEVDFDFSGRASMVAYGSNTAPGVLAHKLAGSAEPVLAEPAWLADFDVVYSAHLSPYGAVPATLQSSPGTSVLGSILRLTEEQLERLSASEPNYELTRSWGCRFDQGFGLGELQTYLSRHGCLVIDGTEVALADVEAKGRRFPALSEPEVLGWVRDLLCPGLPLEDFVITGAVDPELAASRTAALASQSKEPSLPLLP